MIEEFFERNFKLRREETLDNILGYLRHQFPAIKIEYKDDNFIVSGEDKDQQLKCANVINEIMSL